VTGALGPGEFIVGAVQLAITLGCTGAAATIVVRRRLGDLTGAPRAIAVALLAVVGVLVAELVPLLAGVLTRATVPLTAVLVLLAATRVRPVGSPVTGSVAAGPRLPRLTPSATLVGIGLLATLTAWLAYLEVKAPVPVVSVDALGFHFPGVIRYIQTGSLWSTTQYLPGMAQGNYPQYGDLLLLAAALPWHSLALVRYVDPALLALAAFSTYAIARELNAPASTAGLAALALVAIRPVLGPALPDVLTDPLFLAGFGAGALFLLRHWRTGARAELVLAGIGLGIALGTKWYGLTDVPILVVAWLGAALLVRRSRAQLARELGLLVGVIALAGGIWMLRNLILTGNPVFDYRVTVLGATIFPAPPDPIRASVGFALAHYIGDSGVLRQYVWPVFRSDFGVIGLLLAAGTLVAGGFWGRSRLRRDADVDARIPLLFAGAVLTAVAYAITPYTAQGLVGMPVLVNANTRYMAPALVLAAPLLALAAAQLRRLRPVLELVLLVFLIAALHRYLPVPTKRVALTAAALAVAAGVAVVLVRGSTRRVLGYAAAAVLAAVAVAYHYQRVLARTPFVPGDPTVAYVLAHDPAHTRIGITGSWTAQGLVPVAPLSGPRLENTVAYVGPWVRHRLEVYRSAEPFVTAVRRERYPLLEIGTGFPPSADPPQLSWARAAGYRVVTRSPRLILMRTGPEPGGSQ
jgi:hypothetical protein